MTRSSTITVGLAIAGVALAAPATVAAQGNQEYVETEAAPPRDTNAQSRVGAVELETTRARSSDDLLRAVPGLAVVQHGNEGKGLQFYLRGFDAVHGSDFEVSLAGVPLNEFSNVHGHGYVDLGFIVPDAVATIDVTRGAYVLEQGTFGTAGSVNLELGVAPWDRGKALTYEFGTTGRHRVVGLVAPSEGQVVAAEAMLDEGFGEGRRSMRANVAAQQPLVRRESLRVDAITAFGAAEYELPGALRLDDWQAGEVGFYDSYQVGEGAGRRGFATVRAETRDPGGGWLVQPFVLGRDLRLEENFTGYLRDPVNGDRRRQEEASIAGGLKLKRRFDTAVGRLTLLGTVRRDAVRQSERAVGSSGEALGTTRELAADVDRFAGGVQWAEQFGDFGIGVATRAALFRYRVRDAVADIDADELRAVAVPRLSLRYILGDFTVFAAVGRGYRAPEARAVVPRAASSDVRDDADLFGGGASDVTVSTNAEVGTRIYLDDFDAGVTGFHVWLGREVVYDHVSGANLELDGTRRFGVELDAQYRPVDGLHLAADVALVDGRFQTSGAPVPGAPRLLATTRAFYALARALRVGASVTYIGARPLPHGAVAADSVRAGISASASWRRFELGVDVDNPLGLRVRDGEYHYASDWEPGGSSSSLPAIHYVAGAPLTARFHLTYRFDSPGESQP